MWAWVMLVLALSMPIVAVAAGQNDPPGASDNPVLRVTTTLVQVDAVVTDSKGRQITDLYQKRPTGPDRCRVHRSGSGSLFASRCIMVARRV